jgi:hypothetical protein
MIDLAALVVLAIVAFCAFSVAMVLLKAILWIVLLPLRFVFNLLLLPLLILKALIGGLMLLVAGPILLLALLAGLVAMAAALVAPLLPLLFVAFVVWFLVRATSKPAIATRS